MPQEHTKTKKLAKFGSKIFKTTRQSTYRQEKDENQKLERKIANLEAQLKSKEVILDNPQSGERERERE